jgi:hypothetical protein
MPRDTPSVRTGMLLYHPDVAIRIHSFGSMLDARLLSTRNRSTSELLRTL